MFGRKIMTNCEVLYFASWSQWMPVFGSDAISLASNVCPIAAIRFLVVGMVLRRPPGEP
jgi:hypothetical protein